MRTDVLYWWPLRVNIRGHTRWVTPTSTEIPTTSRKSRRARLSPSVPDPRNMVSDPAGLREIAFELWDRATYKLYFSAAWLILSFHEEILSRMWRLEGSANVHETTNGQWHTRRNHSNNCISNFACKRSFLLLESFPHVWWENEGVICAICYIWMLPPSTSRCILRSRCNAAWLILHRYAI